MARIGSELTTRIERGLGIPTSRMMKAIGVTEPPSEGKDETITVDDEPVILSYEKYKNSIANRK